MKNISPRPFLPPLKFALLAGLLALVTISALRADAAPAKSASSSMSTNADVVKHAPSAASTNSATVVAIPPLPPIPGLTSSASGSMKITVNDDDDDDSSPPGKGGGISKIEINGRHHDAPTSVIMEAVLIPIVAIVATFATPILIVFFVCYFKYRRRQENLAIVREYLSKGLPVPPEILGESPFSGSPVIIGDPANRCRSDLRRGFKLAFIGLGVTLALYISDPHSTTWAWGLIPMIMGIGLLVSAWVENRQVPPFNGAPPPPPPPNRFP